MSSLVARILHPNHHETRATTLLEGSENGVIQSITVLLLVVIIHILPRCKIHSLPSHDNSHNPQSLIQSQYLPKIWDLCKVQILLLLTQRHKLNRKLSAFYYLWWAASELTPNGPTSWRSWPHVIFFLGITCFQPIVTNQ